MCSCSSCLFWILCLLPGLAAALPPAVRDFVRQAIPDGLTEYRGRILSAPDSYYLFILRQQSRSGVMCSFARTCPATSALPEPIPH